MNFQRAQKEFTEFKGRVNQCFQLKNDENNMIQMQRMLCTWVKIETQKIIGEIDDERKKNTGLLGGIRKLGLMKPEKDLQSIQTIHEQFKTLKKHISKRMIPKDFQLKYQNIPKNIQEVIQKLKGKKWIKYYAYVKGPFLTGCYIEKRQHFHDKIEQVVCFGLQLIMIEEKTAHKYQRNLVQQIFGRVLRSIGSTSMVLSIQAGEEPLEDPYHLYCFIQDTKFKQNVEWAPMENFQVQENGIFLQHNNKKYTLGQEDLVELFLAEILILPVQTLVSDFIVKIHPQQIQLVKCSEKDQNLIATHGIQTHPALRNPLLFFINTGVQKSAKIQKIHEIVNSQDLFSCFYRALNMMIPLIITDFSCTNINQKVVNSSLCFNLKVFDALWHTFHKIVGMQGWLNEVISPIKDSVSIRQIFGHFCPIFNQLSSYNLETFDAYRQFFQKVEIESYLTTFIKKTTLQKYKNMYVDIDEANLLQKLSSTEQVYSQIFQPIFEEIDLLYLSTIQSIYILDFVCRNKFAYQPKIENLPSSWFNKQIWNKSIKFMKDNRPKFVDIGFDILAYNLGFDTYSQDSDTFEKIVNMEESTAVLQGIQSFINTIREKHSEIVLSSLLEKAFKHEKYEICKKLLDNSVRIRDFKQTFSYQQLSNPKFEQLKQYILQKIRKDSSQMHRIFKWQQLVFVELQKDGKEFQTYDFGKCFIEEQMLKKHFKNGRVINNLSRKDYKFDPTREIAEISYSSAKKFYLEKTPYPLLNYFYQIFYEKLEIPEILPYFTTFFYENKLLTLIEHVPDAINYQKGLMNFSEQQLNSMADEKLVAEGIISTLALLPKQILLKDIVICPSKTIRDQLFILDIQSFYSKAFLIKSSNNINLNSKNSLLLFDIMNTTVHPSIMKKYAELDVIKFVGQCFKSYSKVIQNINEMRKKHCDSNIPSQQFFGLVFQNNYIMGLTERLLIMKRLFKNNLNVNKISYLKVLEILNPQVHDFYNQILQSENYLNKRQNLLLNDNYRKSFVNSGNLIEFFGSFNRLQEDQFTFPDHYYKFCFKGPSESLTTLTANLKRFNAFQNKIPDDLQSYSNEHFEYFIRNIDISDSNKQIKEGLTDIIRKKSKKYLENPEKKLLPLTYIRVSALQTMKQKQIHSFSYERVVQLILQDCKIGDYQINNMPKSLENITYLKLKGLPALKYIGENVLFGQPIQIKHLKVLSIVQCQGLIAVDLKCDILENLQFKKNPSLENIFVYSNFLKNIYCSQNPNINLENIGMYILKGVNVLMCKTACRGDIMKLYSDNYDKYLVKMLKYMTSRFFDPEARYNMILTLTKMKNIDESLFAMAGITTFKGFTTMFNKFSVDVENKILKGIFKIFFENHRVKSFSTHLLTQSSLPTISNKVMSTDRIFKLMTQAVNTSVNQCHFNEIIIERPRTVFTKLNTENFIHFLESIKVQKCLAVCLENMQILSNQASTPKSKSKMDIFTDNRSVKSQDNAQQKPVKETINLNQQDIFQVFYAIWYLAKKKRGVKKLNLVIRSSKFNQRFFKQIFVKNFSEDFEKSLPKKQIRESGSFVKNNEKIKKLEIVTEKYKEGLKKVLDTSYLKRVQSTISDDYNPNEEKDTVSIRKIQIENSIIYQASQKLQKYNDNQNQHYNSVRQLILSTCQLYSFDFIQRMPNLTSFHLKNISFGPKTIQKMQIVFNIILSMKNLKVLELSNYFKKSEAHNKLFLHMFESVFSKMKSLKSLILNNNEISVQNLMSMSKMINNTSISELSLCQTIVLESKSQENVEETRIAYQTFLKDTKKLKSLTIQFEREGFLEAFIQSLSLNQSIVQLNLRNASDISSQILKPLEKNNYISFIRSNKNLPVWLLTHIKSNSDTKYRKSKIISSEDDDEESIVSNNVNVVQMLNNSSTNTQKSDFHRIGLSLDGGGVRGLVLATQMHYLAQQVGWPLHKIFDCIGGTSIGGILTLAATGSIDGQHPICQSEQLIQLFTKYGTQIFKKSQIRQFKNFFDTKYSAASFEGVLKNHFKDSKLSDVLCDTNAIVTAVDRMDNKDYIFRSRQALLSTQRDFYMRDIGRATAAAPTYFPSAEIKNIHATIKLSLLDGGMGMNNPSKLVIDEIKKISANSGNNENFFLLSLGTGRLPNQTIPEYAGLKDLSPIIDSFTESANHFTQRDLGDHYKGHFLRVSPLINISNKRDGQLDNTTDQILKIYQDTGKQAAKKYFKNTVIFGKYRNLNLIQWLRQNTARKYDF